MDDMKTIKIGILHLIGMAVIICSLSSCTSLAPPKQKQPVALSWAERKQILEKMDSWQLQGAIAIRAPQNSGSASITWKQAQQNYTLSIFGPFGASAVQISGQPGLVTLQNAQGKQFSAANAEQLLREQTGWNLPVSSLYYWARGLPVPSLPQQSTFDALHRLSQLQQQDWQIAFTQYAVFDGIELPTRIVLVHPQLNIKMVISQWGKA